MKLFYFIVRERTGLEYWERDTGQTAPAGTVARVTVTPSYGY